MRTKSGKHLWPIPALVLLAVAGAFAVMFSVGLFTPDNSAEASISGPIPGEPFPVSISKTLISLDINGDGLLTHTDPGHYLPSPNLPGDVDVPTVAVRSPPVKSY